MMHDRTCYYKSNGKRRVEDDGDSVSKKKKDVTTFSGGALENALLDY